METYYLSLRPSSLNCIYKTISRTTQELSSDGQILPTRGSFILLSFQSQGQHQLNQMTKLIDEWDLTNIREYVSRLEISSVSTIQSKTILMMGSLHNDLEIKLKELIEKIRAIRIDTKYPRSFIIYQGQDDKFAAEYIERTFTSFNKAEWIITLTKRGSAPMFIKDR